jgi:hypothetical protein
LWWSLVAAAGVVFGCFGLCPFFFRALGVDHLGVWFLDLYAILAAGDAVTLGLDPSMPNPLDPFHRPHVYSHWWLQLGRLGFTRADTPWLGVVWAGAFFTAAVAWLRPRRVGEVGWCLAILCAPPILLAIDRANNDLVIFVLLAPVVPCLLSYRSGVRFLTIPLIAAAVALKAYPAVAGLVLLGCRDARETKGLLWAAGLVMAAMLPDVLSDLAHYSARVPEIEGLMTMGARQIFIGLGASAFVARLAGLVLGALMVGVFCRSKFFEGWVIAPEDRGRWLGFVLGAVVLTGCFFSGASFAYRWIFAIWLAPLLWQLPRDHAAPRRVRRFAAVTAVLLIFALWADAAASGAIGKILAQEPRDRVMQVADRFFLAEQPVTWALFTCLVGFLTHFVRVSLRTPFTAGPAPTRPLQ